MGKIIHTKEMIDGELGFISNNEGQIFLLNEIRRFLLREGFIYHDSGGYLRTTSAGKEKIKISPHKMTNEVPSEACTNESVLMSGGHDAQGYGAQSCPPACISTMLWADGRTRN